MKKACAATIATAAAVALAAGMTSPASADAQQTASVSRSGKAQLTPHHRITLITGDRVVVDAKGRVVGLEPAKGRAHIPVQLRKADGHTYVLPSDVVRLVSSGKLDQRLFDITELNKAATRKSQAKGL
ncbi:peptidase S8, partial [Streptomyces griseorubiginosus]